MSEKRKLLVATDNFLPRHDGISRFLKEVLPVLQELYEVTVVSPNFGTYEAKGYNLVQLPLSKMKIGDYQIPKLCFKSVRALVMKNDLVFCQGLGPIGYAAIRASYKKKKCIAFTHSIDWELVPKAIENPIFRSIVPDIVKWFVRRQYKKCNLLLMPAESISETFTWNKIDTPRQIVHLGVDSKEFVPTKDKKGAKMRLGLPTDQIIIGYHGRLAPEKDLKTLVRGFNRVKGVTLLIIGSGLTSIENSLTRKNIILVGAKDDVVPYLQAMDIYCLTSLTETTSLSVLEAMSCGLPVISTPVGYVNDYIKSGQNGILIPKQNPYALAKALEPLKASEMQREKLGFAARKTVEKDFSWDKTRNRIKEIFADL